MVDSIRPFVSLIRTLSRRKVDTAQTSTAPGRVGEGTENEYPTADVATSEQLEQRLRARLADAGAGDEEQSGQTFVETVLLFQLGDDVGRDPAFADVVAKVSSQLRGDPQTRAKLAQLIASLRD